MFVVHVHVRVKEDRVQDFIAATRENAFSSINENGNRRFDIIQSEEDKTQFILEEIYLSPADAATHKDTQHYKKWKNLAESMMAEPRRSFRYRNIYPADEEWGK